jgi:Fic family protein
MMTLRQFGAAHVSGRLEVPASTLWYLSELAEARGKQALFTRQAPQRLKALRESAIVESAVSSNRIEGVEVEPARAGTVVFGSQVLRDRDEEEVRGYRSALSELHESAAGTAVSVATIRHLHALSRAGLGDAGEFKRADNDIIERYPDGRSRLRFRTVPAALTGTAMDDLVTEWSRCAQERWVPPEIALAAFNLDFLCIHPFRDGNGRVSRLLFLLQAYHAGFEVGRYISFERLIEQNKARYYETLEQSSGAWHDGRHDPWPYINYLLYILTVAYREFESRLGDIRSPRGAKTGLVEAAIGTLSDPFRITDLQDACPGVGIDLIRRVLKDMRGRGLVECLGRGARAQWRKLEHG